MSKTRLISAAHFGRSLTEPMPAVVSGRILSRLVGVICVFLAACCWAAPVAAQGLVVTATPAGEAGLQLDAATISPRLPRPVGIASGGELYTVQPGDTLFRVASRFGVDLASLAVRNNLADLDQIQVGQTLRIDAPAGPGLILPRDGPLARLQFWPWPPVQGQTLVVWLQARTPVTYTLRLGDRAYPVLVEGRRGWAMIPISPLAVPETRPLTLTIGSTSIAVAVPVEAGIFDRYDIPASASEPILSQADKVNAEAVRLAGLFAEVSPLDWTPRSRFVGPFDGDYPRTAPFGSRRTYGGGTAVSAHSGEDFSAPPGTPVLVPAAGLVVLAEPLFVRGNAVVIDHGRGVYTGYWHLSALNVKVGDRVAPGQVLGEVGSTGLSTGAHLHWEMRVNGAAVDPLQWLAPWYTPEQKH